MHSVNTQVVTLDTFKKFLETRQMETKTDNELKMIIEVGYFNCGSLCEFSSKGMFVCDVDMWVETGWIEIL